MKAAFMSSPDFKKILILNVVYKTHCKNKKDIIDMIGKKYGVFIPKRTFSEYFIPLKREGYIVYNRIRGYQIGENIRSKFNYSAIREFTKVVEGLY